MWSDQESSLDFLNFNETAESIKDLITETDLMPISVGVFGDWGAGKSTVLDTKAAHLEECTCSEVKTIRTARSRASGE